MKRFERYLGYGVVFAVILTVAVGLFAMNAQAQTTNTTPVSGTTIGYVDDQIIDRDFPDIVEAKKQIKSLEDEVNSANAEFNARVKTIQTQIQRQFDEKTKGLSDEEKAKYMPIYEEMFQAQVAALKKEFDLKKMEIQNKAQQIWKVAFDKVRETISVVAKEQNVGLVIKKDIVWFGGKDLTADVLKKAAKK